MTAPCPLHPRRIRVRWYLIGPLLYVSSELFYEFGYERRDAVVGGWVWVGWDPCVVIVEYGVYC